jgi:hypothetical protein
LIGPARLICFSANDVASAWTHFSRSTVDCSRRSCCCTQKKNVTVTAVHKNTTARPIPDPCCADVLTMSHTSFTSTKQAPVPTHLAVFFQASGSSCGDMRGAMVTADKQMVKWRASLRCAGVTGCCTGAAAAGVVVRECGLLPPDRVLLLLLREPHTSSDKIHAALQAIQLAATPPCQLVWAHRGMPRAGVGYLTAAEQAY